MTVTRSLSRQGASVGSLGYILGGSPLRQTPEGEAQEHTVSKVGEGSIPMLGLRVIYEERSTGITRQSDLASPMNRPNTGRDYQVMPNAYQLQDM